MSKKSEPVIRRVSGIDEKELLESMSDFGEKKAVITPATAMKEESEPVTDEKRDEREPEEPVRNKKQNREGGYKSLYLKPRELKNRQCVYISQDLHETILAIVGEIAVKSMTVGAFIDTVLRQHLEEHKDEINNLYRRKRDNLIK